MYREEPLKKYLDELASKSPTPGGGSVSALVGALAAGLISMVSNFTMGKEEYQAQEAEVKQILSTSEELRSDLMQLVEADTRAYGRVSQALKMPRGTEEEKAKRRAAIQEALKEAAQVPLKATTDCFQIMKLSGRLVDIGNVNLISDVGVAVILAEAALKGAALNVEINLLSIKDERFNKKAKDTYEPYLKECEEIKARVWQKTKEKMKGG